MKRFIAYRNGIVGVLSAILVAVAVQDGVALQSIEVGNTVKVVFVIAFTLFAAVLHLSADALIGKFVWLRRWMFGGYGPEGVWLEFVVTPGEERKTADLSSTSLAVVEIFWDESQLKVTGADYKLLSTRSVFPFKNEIGYFTEGKLKMVGEYSGDTYTEAGNVSVKKFARQFPFPTSYSGYFYLHLGSRVYTRNVYGYRLNEKLGLHRDIVNAHRDGGLLELASHHGGLFGSAAEATPSMRPHLMDAGIVIGEPLP